MFPSRHMANSRQPKSVNKLCLFLSLEMEMSWRSPCLSWQTTRRTMPIQRASAESAAAVTLSWTSPMTPMPQSTKPASCPVKSTLTWMARKVRAKPLSSLSWLSGLFEVFLSQSCEIIMWGHFKCHIHAYCLKCHCAGKWCPSTQSTLLECKASLNDFIGYSYHSCFPHHWVMDGKSLILLISNILYLQMPTHKDIFRILLCGVLMSLSQRGKT